MTSKTYCVEPYRTLHYDARGRPGPCCTFRGNRNSGATDYDSYINSEWLADIKQKMMDGERVNGCENCYRKEDRQELSMRQLRNEKYGELYNTDIHDVFISFGNVCNKSCVVCRPGRSHMIAKEYRTVVDSKWVAGTENIVYDAQALDPKISGGFILQWDNYIKAASVAKCIYLDGGEPLITSQCNTMLDHLIDTNNTDKDIFTTTNGSVTVEILDKLAQFKSVHFNISIEGINELYQAVRYPHSWDWFTDNLKLLQSYNFDYTFTCVINAFNAQQLPEIIEYFINNKYNTTHGFEFTTLNNQPYIGIDQMPVYMRMAIAGKMASYLNQCSDAEQYTINNAIRHLTNKYEANDLHKTMLQEYCKTFGELRNIDYIEMIPWIKQ